MLLKNVASQGIYLFEYVVATGLPATGDSANITGYSAIDGGAATVFGTANPTEISSAHMPGVYWQPLAQSETNGNAIAYMWKSSTSGNAVNPVLILTTGVSIPAVAPGAAGGSFIAGTNAATTVTTSFTSTFTGNLTGSVGSVTGAVGSVTAGVTVTTNNDKTGYSLTVTPPTAATIATTIWQDTTSGDFTTAGSIGKSLFTSGNAPGAASGLALVGSNVGTASSVTGAVGSVTGNVGGSVGSVTGNVGGNVVGSTASVTGAVGSVTGNVGGNVVGSVASVTAAVTLSLTETLGSPRALDSIADGSFQVNDALWAAVGAGVGIKDASSGTNLIVKTPSTATVLRTYTITTTTIPTTVPDKIA